MNLLDFLHLLEKVVKVVMAIFIGLVLTGLFSFRAGLVPGLALCLGTGAAERPQEILYISNTN
jgi:hypothetical protein